VLLVGHAGLARLGAAVRGGRPAGDLAALRQPVSCQEVAEGAAGRLVDAGRFAAALSVRIDAALGPAGG
jgi:hypothetical protein